MLCTNTWRPKSRAALRPRSLSLPVQRREVNVRGTSNSGISAHAIDQGMLGLALFRSQLVAKQALSRYKMAKASFSKGLEDCS